MPMPGSFVDQAGTDDEELQMESGGEETTTAYDDIVLTIPADSELALEALLEEDDEDDDEEEDDDDFMEDEEDDDDLDEDISDEFEIEFDDDANDPELTEAERMAAAAGLDDRTGAAHPTARTEQRQYTLAVDPDGGDVFLVNAEGEREDIGDALGLGAGAFRGLSPQSTLAALRRFISRHTTRETGTATPAAQRTRAAPASSDDGEDDDDSSYSWGYHRGRASAAGLFKTATEPTAEGMQLERKGLFGRPSLRYEGYPRRRFSQYYCNMNDALRAREYRTSARPIDRSDIGERAIPNSTGVDVARYDANVYCGQYSKDGTFFYTCAQDFRVRVYDMMTASSSKSVNDSREEPETMSRRMRSLRMMYGNDDKSSLRLIKTIHAHEQYSSWTITDANLSPDNSKMIWSSIGPVVGMSSVKEDDEAQTSLDFGAGASGRSRHFGIWSIRFSADGREIVAGASSGAIHVYDLESRRTILSISAHNDDVNAVCFADTASSNILVSGSDDNYLKVWDRRSLGDSGRFTRPSGVLVGHTEGVTYVAPKGDGRFVCSNGKDQTCKLWDLRQMYSADAFDKLDRLDVSVRGFDYRRGLYRKARYAKHPHDCSVVTYTGHTVLQTLIRCHFSPEATTGQRYIYSGSYDGKIHVWNLDGTIAKTLETRGVVRDVSWAPYVPVIMSSAWTEMGGVVKGFGYGGGLV